MLVLKKSGPENCIEKISVNLEESDKLETFSPTALPRESDLFSLKWGNKIFLILSEAVFLQRVINFKIYSSPLIFSRTAIRICPRVKYIWSDHEETHYTPKEPQNFANFYQQNYEGI